MSDQANGLLSPFLRATRIKATLPYIQGNLLDIGCGVGVLSESYSNYTGVDTDIDSINIAKKNYPFSRFLTFEEFNNTNEKYDTISALAVIEHVKNPIAFLLNLKKHLSKNGIIILTTPQPFTDIIHLIGSKIKLFSAEANEEHEELYNYKKMKKIASSAGFMIHKYKKFLFFANQLFVLKAKN